MWKAYNSLTRANWDQALKYANKSLTLRKDLGDKTAIADSLENLGFIFDMKGNWDQALKYYQQSLKIREGLGNKQAVANSLNNVGRMHIGDSTRDLNQALTYCEESLSILKGFGNNFLIIRPLENIGWINFGLADYYVVTCKVTFEDLANFVDDWLDSGSIPGNLNSAGDVDFKDYSIFASYWLDYCPDGWPLK